MSLLLAGDIGGTKTLLSLQRLCGEGLLPVAQERYVSADWEGLAPMVLHFLEACREASGGASERPEAACFAVAGPVQGGRARVTNLSWEALSEAHLAEATGLTRVELVNDFAVLIYGLPHLGAQQQAPIRDGMVEAGAPVLILGAGTGLGVAVGIPTAAGLQAVASEAAHASFAPRTPQEWELSQWLQADLGLERLSIERVVSGTGLGHVARWLLATRQAAADHPLSDAAQRWAEESSGEDRGDLPAAVTAAAADGDPLAAEALELWLGAYGAVTGDLALTTLSRGGIWLAGGTAAKQLHALRSDRFEAAFLAKGRLRPVLEPMPIAAVLDPAIGSFSAACRAAMLLG